MTVPIHEENILLDFQNLHQQKFFYHLKVYMASSNPSLSVCSALISIPIRNNKAKELCESNDWKFTGIIIDTSNLENDWYRLVELGCERKTHYNDGFSSVPICLHVIALYLYNLGDDDDIKNLGSTRRDLERVWVFLATIEISVMGCDLFPLSEAVV